MIGKQPNIHGFLGSLRQVINVVFTLLLHPSTPSASGVQGSGTTVGELHVGEAARPRDQGPGSVRG